MPDSASQRSPERLLDIYPNLKKLAYARLRIEFPSYVIEDEELEAVMPASTLERIVEGVELTPHVIEVLGNAVEIYVAAYAHLLGVIRDDKRQDYYKPHDYTTEQKRAIQAAIQTVYCKLMKHYQGLGYDSGDALAMSTLALSIAAEQLGERKIYFQTQEEITRILSDEAAKYTFTEGRAMRDKRIQDLGLVPRPDKKS